MLAPAAAKGLMALKASTGSNPLLFSAAIIGGINLLGFGITASTHTHKITDLFGTGAFVASAAASAYVNGVYAHPYSRPLLLTAAVGVWGVRLAGFLFERIMTSPKDPRLDAFMRKPGEPWLDRSRSFFPLNLAGFWTIQAAWAFVCSLPVTLSIFNFGTAAAAGSKAARLGVGGKIAFATFLGGFAFEAAADWQKRAFKARPGNKNRFMSEGVWSLSRHPNYFGEMVVWWSLFAAAVPLLKGPKQLLLGIASPLFVTSLLLWVSGIPMLEEKAEERYGKDEKYQKWRDSTPLLVPYWKSLKIPFLPYQ